MSDALVEAFRALSVANISDALDRLGIPGGCLGLVPLATGYRMVGRAFTVRYVPVGVTRGTVGDYIDDLAPGTVVVLDNGGRLHCTVWGDILTAVAHQRGLAGTVIDGVCRDVARALELKYPIFSRGRFMMTGKDRVQVDAMQVPVSIGGVLVRPGDLLVGNDDGVVVVPHERAQEVLEVAQQISAAEEAILAEALAGTPLAQARARHGYHALQRG
ncbi:MAG TPA: RraA family protein [Chloroflexota bacterium]|nr:RraA family protein [Chloroflexota bacterium]